MKIQPYTVQINYSKQKQVNTNIDNTKQIKDIIEISTKGKEELQGLEAMDAKRLEYLEKLKVSIKEGTYEVDSKQVAEKMVEYFQNKTKREDE